MNKELENFHLTDTEESDDTVFTDEKGAKIEREYAKILSEFRKRSVMLYVKIILCMNLL